MLPFPLNLNRLFRTFINLPATHHQAQRKSDLFFFQEFHNNLVPDMCYVEDIFHIKCSHWAEKPRIYHRCAAADPTDATLSCFNKKTCGSAQENSLCQKCTTIWIHKLEQGASAISVGQDCQSGKTVVIKEKKPRARTLPFENEQLPSGFFSWRIVG